MIFRGDTDYTWSRPEPNRRRYELLDGESKLAELAWADDDTTAAASSEGQRWTFTRTGFQSPILTIRNDAEASDLARFEPHTGGGGVLLLDSLEVEWKPNLWRGQWSWKTLGGSDLLVFKRNFSSGNREGEMRVQKEALGFSQTLLLALFGWYMVILVAEESAIAD